MQSWGPVHSGRKTWQQVQSNGGWRLSRWITYVVDAKHHARVPMHAFSNKTNSGGTFLLPGKGTCEDGNLTAGMTLGRATMAPRGCHFRYRFDCRVPWPCPDASVQKTTTLAQALSLPGQLTRQGGTNCQHVCKHFIWPASAILLLGLLSRCWQLLLPFKDPWDMAMERKDLEPAASSSSSSSSSSSHPTRATVNRHPTANPPWRMPGSVGFQFPT